jgi:hypothetical protein
MSEFKPDPKEPLDRQLVAWLAEQTPAAREADLLIGLASLGFDLDLYRKDVIDGLGRRQPK